MITETNNNQIATLQNEFDALLGYFLKRGFETVAAREITGLLIEQADRENVKVFTIIDSLKGLQDVKLNQAVANIINSSKRRSSILGFKIQSSIDQYDLRNIESLEQIGKKFIETEIEPFVVTEIIDDQPYVEPGYVDVGYVEE